MIYRWIYYNDPTLWVERQEIPGNTTHYEYRVCHFPHWLTIEFINKETFLQMVPRQTTSEWILDLTHMKVDPNDLFPIMEDKKVDKPIHKCYCNWNDVYREGCRCGGI